MKTLKFIIPRTAASITALVDSLNDELDTINNVKTVPFPAAVDEKVDTGVEQDNTNNDNVVELKPTTAANVVVVAPGEKATGAAGIVEVDADGIPWDARIHGSSKNTLKKGGTWKLARGTDPALVTTVIAELRETMAAPGATETVTTSTPAPAASTTAPPPAKTVAPAPAHHAIDAAPAPAHHAIDAAPAPEVVEVDPIYIVEGSGEFTAEALLASGWTDEQIATLPVKEVEAIATTNVVDGKTFPDLMAAITAAGMDEATVLVAVQNQGIQATPLLAARPDLVPAVYAELFPA